jgi:uncharacterized surface protein with fasciclin (FAS1) repeats
MPNSTFFIENGLNIQGLGLDAQIGPDAEQFLEYTIIPGRILYSSSFSNGSFITTATGINIMIRVLNGSAYVDNAKMTWKDILVANCVIHVVDMVVLGL